MPIKLPLYGYRIFFELREALLDEYEAFLLALRKKLARLGKAQQKVLIQTQSGKELFDEQIATQIAYLGRFIAGITEENRFLTPNS